MTEAEKENSALEGDRQDQEAEVGEKEAPQLPETGKKLVDFVPEGWELLDSVELDFNEDGMTEKSTILQSLWRMPHTGR